MYEGTSRSLRRLCGLQVSDRAALVFLYPIYVPIAASFLQFNSSSSMGRENNPFMARLEKVPPFSQIEWIAPSRHATLRVHLEASEIRWGKSVGGKIISCCLSLLSKLDFVRYSLKRYPFYHAAAMESSLLLCRSCSRFLLPPAFPQRIYSLSSQTKYDLILAQWVVGRWNIWRNQWELEQVAQIVSQQRGCLGVCAPYLGFHCFFPRFHL